VNGRKDGTVTCMLELGTVVYVDTVLHQAHVWNDHDIHTADAPRQLRLNDSPLNVQLITFTGDTGV
jgi:hypothetical protein